MSDREPAESSERAALVRQLNAEIRATAERLPDDDASLEFYCECGCWEILELTVEEYDALGDAPFYLPGHSKANDDTSPTG